ncbi:hypothetical protein CBA19CS22_17810 [Caballeronia novacaledonica]|uniref:Uncharacterized protein n=1 Tax=Caballeronia novacaledonica TaxID=1544861 RepID=A0ACB5QTD2_9BURK|nr:hypothetical protein CBA19CS22_17810 [Caballeronia novacaledonica]
MKEYRSLSHTRWDCKYHVVFIPSGGWHSIVNAVVPYDQLDLKVEHWCREILEMSPTALAIAKRSFNADSDSIRGIAGQGMKALAMYYETAESKEGVNAFLEKRKPRFREVAAGKADQ